MSRPWLARPAGAERAMPPAQAETALESELPPLIAQRTPDGTADTVLHDATQAFAFARHRFNDAVRQHNDAASLFPTRLIAGLFGFAAAGSL